MICTEITDLPTPPAGKTGWPWTDQCDALSEVTADGRPWPKISIVTPSYNQGEFIEETIRSVLLQGYPNLEYIIIDGGSTDSTIEIIKKYEKHLTCWVSEPDRGQSHAINKGLEHCTGEIFNWICSDDFLCSGALAAVGKAWIRTPKCIIAGGGINFRDSGEILRTYFPNDITVRNLVQKHNPHSKGHCYWLQPATFIPRASMEEIGGVREDLHFSMDRFMMIQLLQNCELTYVMKILAKYRMHDASKTVCVQLARFKVELMAALKGMASQVDMSVTEFRQEHARILVSCSKLEMFDGNHWLAAKFLIRALQMSPRGVLSELSGDHTARNCGRMLFQVLWKSLRFVGKRCRIKQLLGSESQCK